MFITHVSYTHVIHLYFHTCNTPKTPHMYYRCSTTGHVCKDEDIHLLATLRKDFVILQFYWWLFSSTKHCSGNMAECMVMLQSYFPSNNYQQDKSTYYDYWITLQTALKIAASNLYCKITLVWLDSSLSVVSYPMSWGSSSPC